MMAMAGQLRALLRKNAPPIALAIITLSFWELLVTVFQIEQFLLPKPSVILGEYLAELRLFLDPASTSILFEATGATLREAIGGFLLGCGGGIAIAMITARWTAVNEALMPFAIAANSVPIVAFAPIMNNWFGTTNPFSKMAIVAIIVFFPTMINTVRGLTLIDANQLELMRSYGASPTRIMRDLRIPNSLPFVFSALRIASSLSVIGAVVGEFFGGPRATLGVFITQEASSFDFARAWAAIIMASLIGLALYFVVLALERWLMPWHVSVRGDQ